MRKLAFAATLLILMLLPVSARALSVDLVAYVNMPLAVDAVASLNGVDIVQLGSLCASLNEAEVSPEVFCQELRYTPVALTGPALVQQPTLVSYISEQRRHGIRGDALGRVMARRLTDRYYVAADDYLNDSYYVEDDYIPTVVITRVRQYEPDPLLLIDMPLAVAYVDDLGYVPEDRLATFCTSLNDAWVPPAQFVNVVQYAPIAQPQFVPFVQTQVSQGVVGPALIASIDQQLPAYGLPARTYVTGSGRNARFTAPAGTAFVPGSTSFAPGSTSFVPTPAPGSATFNPALTQAQNNPHGGPPGQLKRTYGYRTGAQVVHGGVQPGQPGFAPAIASPRALEGHGRGHGRGQQQFVAPPQSQPAFVQHGNGQHGNGGGHGRGHQNVAAPQPQFVPQPQPAFVQHGNGHGNGGGHGRGHQVVAAPQPQFVPQPQPAFVQHGNGEGHGRGHQFVAAPAPQPQVVAPQPQPVFEQHGNGHGRGHQVAAAPTPQPLFVPQPAPQAPPQPVAQAAPQGGRGPQGAGPPGQNGGNGKGKGKKDHGQE